MSEYVLASLALALIIFILSFDLNLSSFLLSSITFISCSMNVFNSSLSECSIYFKYICSIASSMDICSFSFLTKLLHVQALLISLYFLSILSWSVLGNIPKNALITEKNINTLFDNQLSLL